MNRQARPAGSVDNDPKETLTTRFDRPLRLARDQNSSVFRAQGRLDALEQPLAHVRPGPCEQEEDADERQIGLHRRRQRRRGYPGQPRILRLQSRIDRGPLRIVGVFRVKLGNQDNCAIS